MDFKIPEVLTAYNEITSGKSDFCKFYANGPLKSIDDRIYSLRKQYDFLTERHGELKRELKAYGKPSAEFCTDTPTKEASPSPPTLSKYRFVHTAQALLDCEEETNERRFIIRSHLSKLDDIIGTLSKANMHLSELIRQKEVEVSKQPSRPASQEEDIEMKVIRPKPKPTPRYQQQLDRTPRTRHAQIPYAVAIDHPPQRILVAHSPTKNSVVTGISLTGLLTANSSVTHSSPSASTLTSPRTDSEIPELAISFDKNALSTG